MMDNQKLGPHRDHRAGYASRSLLGRQRSCKAPRRFDSDERPQVAAGELTLGHGDPTLPLIRDTAAAETELGPYPLGHARALLPQRNSEAYG